MDWTQAFDKIFLVSSLHKNLVTHFATDGILHLFHNQWIGKPAKCKLADLFGKKSTNFIPHIHICTNLEIKRNLEVI